MENGLEKSANTNIFNRYGRFLKKLEENVRAEGEGGKCCERIEKARQKAIGYFLRKDVMSYSRENHYEMCFLHSVRLDMRLLHGPEGKLYLTTREYANQFKEFFGKFLHPGSENDITVMPA